MKKQLIIGLVILMGVALLGIIAVQFYWFNNSVKASNELFDRSVNEALNRAVRRYEIHRDIHIIEQTTGGNDSIPGFQSLYPTPPVPADVNVRIELDSLKKNLRVISRPSRLFGTRRSRPRIDTTTKFNPDHSNVNPRDSVYKRYGINGSTNSLDTTNFPYGQKAKQLEVLANQIATEFKGWESGRNIDTEQLNEIIRWELDNNNIPIEYNYAILISDSVIISDPSPLSHIDRQWFRVNLFPNDIFRRGIFLAIYFPDRYAFIGRTMFLLLASSILFTLVILVTFILSIHFILRQKKISEMKSDFINNMTHEFKTPIATISVAADSILNERVINDPEKVRFFTGMIKKENKRMDGQVEQILQIARLDRKEFEFRFQKVDAHELIGEAIESISIQVEKRGGKIETQLEAANPIVTTDPTHFTNMIYNLLDNANKYSPEKPEILVKTLNDPKGLVIIVEDHGLGMSKAVMSKIFEKFYRQTTGNIHNIKGFGLGLSYTKAILEANKGDIRVHSELGKGSRFEVFIPFMI